MPPTGKFTLDSDTSLPTRRNSTRVRSLANSSRKDETLPSSITTRRSMKTLMKHKNSPAAPVDLRHEFRHILKDCKVVLVNAVSQRGQKDHPAFYTATRDALSGKHPVQLKAAAETELGKRVTVRRKTEQTDSNGNKIKHPTDTQRHTTHGVESDHHSIIEIHDSIEEVIGVSNKRNTKSVAAVPIAEQTRVKPHNDILKTPHQIDLTAAPVKRISTRRSSRAHNNRDVSYANPDRVPIETNTIETELDAVVSKEIEPVVPIRHAQSICENVQSSHQTTPWSVAVGRECSAFKTLIISNKRIAPAISEFGLKKLKYPNLSSTQEPKPPQRISATANSRKSDDVPVHRPSIIEQKSTKFKPPAVPPDSIIEVPESPVAREVPLPVLPESDTVNDASRNCNLPLPLIAIEEEDVEKENVNDFISNSQSSGMEQSSKLRQKNPPLNQLPKVLTKSKPVAREAPIPGVVPFKDTIYSASKNCTPSLPLIAIEEEDVEKENVYDFISNSQSSDMEQPSKLKQKKNPKKKQPKGSVKPKPKQQKHAIGNPFGCSGVRLKHLIKKIGGGPVKPPAVVDYVINLEIPNTPPKPTAGRVAHRKDNDRDLPREDDLPPVDVRHSVVHRSISDRHSAVDGLQGVTSRKRLLTSTPAVTSNLAENANRPSPWRVQDDTIIPRTSYAPRNKQMLPSYESFSVEPSGTERGKSLPQSASIEDLELATAQTTPSVAGEDAIITDSDFRQVEKMYNELKAVSDMSEKLITAMRKHKTSSSAKQRDRRVYETSMHQACQKLKKWYDHSMKSFNHSIRIIQNIERVTNRSVGPSPLTLEQQRTVEKFNQSSDHFRLMVDELQAAVNDSDRCPRSSSKGTEKENVVSRKSVIDVVPGRKRSMNDSDRENRPPAVAPSATQTMVRSGTGYITTMAHKSNTASAKTPADVVLLPDRGKGATRNPLIALNFVPLAQHDSPLMSPLAKEPVLVATSVNREKRFVPRELLYDKENESIVPKDPLCDKANESILAIDSHVETRSPPGAVEVAPQKRVEKSPESSVVELNDETMNAPKNKSISKDNETLCENDTSNDDYFGFDSQEYVESSLPQITLPNPLNISSDTLHQRLDNVRKLLPKQPLLRHRPVTRPRNSGPTRLPLRMPRVFTSPTKRPYTLPEFVASTPRPETVGAPGGSSAGGGEVDTVAVPDVSAIGQTMTEDDPPAVDQPEVVLFDTPDAPKWKSNSVLHRTYARVPRRRKKNIYLLNLGLDDDDDEEVDDDAGNASDDSQNQWSDAEGIAAKRKKKKKKNKPRRPPVPVEQTEEFQNFVESFNSMCDEVDRYNMIIE